MKCSPSLLLLSGCLFSVSVHAQDKPASANSDASSGYVIDLYVDTKTKQIYSEPGEGRVRMGSFEKVSDNKPKPGTEGGGALPPGKAGEAVAGAEGKPQEAPKPQGMGYSNWKSPDPFK